MTFVAVALKTLPHADGLPLPAYATERSAGADLMAAIADPLILAPGERMLVPTGVAIAMPEGYEAQVRPRSGLAWKNGVTVLNSPGTIDADYRGEIKVALINLGREPFEITRGMRIAQIIVAPVSRAAWRVAASLETSARGEGGFGSTGVRVLEDADAA